MSVSLEQIEADSALGLAEKHRLAELETTIDRSVRTALEAGSALREIRDTWLYRTTHPTFEGYAKTRFGFERSHVYRLIDAARVVEVVSPLGTPPKAESHARELVPLLNRPEKLVEVWESATRQAELQERPVTAGDVRAARQRLTVPHRAATAPAAPAEPAEQADSNDLRFAHIEEAVQLLKMLPAPEQMVWPTDAGDVEAVEEAVVWLGKFAPQLVRAWKQHRATARRLRVV